MEEKKCNCSPDCTCGCQDGKECTCDENYTCGCQDDVDTECGCECE